MKNWFTIGLFSRQAGVTVKALRVYEKLGLIRSHSRGENGYRYYNETQIELLKRIKEFKSLGFSLSEIRSILEIDSEMNSNKLEVMLQGKLEDLKSEETNLIRRKSDIHKILSSLRRKNQGLDPDERRLIMSYFEKLSVVVAGVRDLERTALYIKQHIRNGGLDIPVHIWNDEVSTLPPKPYVLVISETQLRQKDLSSLRPDVVVIKELSEHSSDLEKAYLQLYSGVGPHMSTIMNADDRAVVRLAGQDVIKKGKIYYFSKNSGLEDQIKNIGGAVCSGDEIQIFGFNRKADHLSIKVDKILGVDEEVALLASLVAVMDIGLTKDTFPSAF